MLDLPDATDQRLPLYQRLKDAFAARIAQGEWRPGAAIPPEVELAVEYGVALGTVRKAIDGLVQEGLIDRRQGRGTFVRKADFTNALFRFFRHTQDGEPVRPTGRLLSRRVGKAGRARRAGAGGRRRRRRAVAARACGWSTARRWWSTTSRCRCRDFVAGRPRPETPSATCFIRSTNARPARWWRARASISRSAAPTPRPPSGSASSAAIRSCRSSGLPSATTARRWNGASPSGSAERFSYDIEIR